jgi:ATP-dependent DNA helicase DinG
VLPAYDRLVIDEGHHLEDAAASHLGSTVTHRGLQRLFSRLDRRGKGLLTALVARLSSSDDLLSTASLDLVHARLVPAVHAAREKATFTFDLIGTLLDEAGGPVLRLTDDFARHPIWNAGLALALRDLLGELEMLGEGLRLVRERLESDAKRAEAVAPLLNEMRAVAKRLQGAGDALRRTLQPTEDQEPGVRWVEARGKERNLAVTSVPLDLAPILRKDLFERAKTAVVTSATLTADKRFDFISRRLGVDAMEFEPTTATFASPFDYPRQSILAIASDAPPPNVDPAGHIRFLVRATLDVAERSDGGMFVLFTSHRDVRLLAAELRARGSDRRWPLLVHGEDSRDALLERFRDSSRAILLGTASFWEGVDVPGRALRALVIAKLPVKVPTDPMTAAHCEAIAARGGDAFVEYMVPHAALRLKQGFGRLIRTGTDRGVVVLTDPRIVQKAYGRALLDGLPPARRVVARWERIVEELTSFYGADP